MALSPDQVHFAGYGEIRVAPKGTAGPTDVSTDWPTGWVALGYTNEDGLTMSRSAETENIPVWQSISPVKYALTSVQLTQGYTLMQWNRDTVDLYFGGTTITQPDSTNFPDLYRMDIPSAPSLDERAFGYEWHFDADIIYRMVVSRGFVQETDDVSLTRSSGAGLPMTVVSQPSSNELLAYVLTNDPAFAA